MVIVYHYGRIPNKWPGLKHFDRNFFVGLFYERLL